MRHERPQSHGLQDFLTHLDFLRARRAGLVYVNDFEKGYSRRRCGKGFTYLSTRGKTLRSARTRKRIEALAIPPAWEDVWICPSARGHIQATGRDEAGRKQYRYHERWHAISTATKFDRMALFGRLLPRIRQRIENDLARSKLDRRRVLAAVVRLIDEGCLRVGNERYTETHGSRGVTTLAHDNVHLDGVHISLDFEGKSGREREIELSDRRLAKVMRECADIDSQFLFCYRDASGGSEAAYQPVESGDVNEWLREAASEVVTAKDFRTWWGSVIALAAIVPRLADATNRKTRDAAVREAVRETAEALGNTPAVGRSSYIHPAVLAAAENGELLVLLERTPPAQRNQKTSLLDDDERRFLALLPRLIS